MRQKSQALRARYDENLLQARIEANRQKALLVQAAKDEAASLLAAAEASVARDLQDGRAALERQIAEAKQRSDAEAADVAALLSSKVDAQLSIQ
jgi:F0F1-type ATP synthase membrane subunit b/b'